MMSVVSCFSTYRAHRGLLSFPTRRSSDLQHDPGHPHALAADDRQERALVAGDGSRGHRDPGGGGARARQAGDRKSTRLNSSHLVISYAVFCLQKKISEIQAKVTK